MSRFSLVAMTAMLTVFATAASAQHAGMMGHNASLPMSQPDAREEVHFPPEMQTNFLKNMRDHVETLDAILQAVAAGDFASASRIATERLGLDLPAAAACKPADAAANGSAPMRKPPAPELVDAMMALYMPEPMRAIGLSMHTSASEFATVAAGAAATHDTASVIAALSRITPNCVACHSAYRLR